MDNKIKLPKYFESLSGVFSFVIILILAHLFWKITVRGDESDLMVTFLGMDISGPFNYMANHTTFMVHKVLNLFGYYPTLEPYNIFRYDNNNAIRIVWSCTGLKQAFIFTVIILLFSGSWKQKVWFIPAGLVVVYIYNLMRISFLCGLVRDHRDLFDLMHGEITKYLFYALIFGMWVLWEEKLKFIDNLHLNLKRLLSNQTNTWPLAAKNYADLDKIEQRKISFVGFDVKIQFNPARAGSTNAKIDKNSIESRPCFLCESNRPPEQKGIKFGNYTILINPFPIFKEHFTIVSNSHVNQSILPYYNDMLSIGRAMSNYVIFYNGPKCGASAPDHLHFQAVGPENLPLIKDYFYLKGDRVELIQNEKDNFLYLIKDYIRNVYCIESVTPFESKRIFKKLYLFLKGEQHEEPMINVYSLYKNNTYYTWVVPRNNFRPWQFFEEDEEFKITVSPAAVEMAGVLITPVKEHFEKIDRMDVISILEQAGRQ